MVAPTFVTTRILRDQIKRLKQYKRKPAFLDTLIDRPEGIRGRCADVVIVDDLDGNFSLTKNDTINQLLPVAPKIFALETPV